MNLDSRLSKGPVEGKTHFIGEVQVDTLPPQVNNVVNLKSEGSFILVRILTVNNDAYTGEIMGFDGQDGPSFQGKQKGETIEFNYKHIFVINR